MTYDLLIKNGTIIDGTGSAGYQADLAVADGRIVEIGKIGGGAREVIDADGLAVSPGFVDPHSHYDAQICWDSRIGCSPEHGVTSVVMGNCGVGIAPCRPETREMAVRDLVSVEGIPFDALWQGIGWDWESFPDYMAAAGRRGAAINLGFLAPLTPFRHFVMGEDSMERAARPDELRQINTLLREAIEAGALGFSTTIFRQHIGFKGRPLACRLADREELGTYARTLRDLNKGAIEIAVTQIPGILSEEEVALLEFLADESGRPITWSAMLAPSEDPAVIEQTLAMAGPLIRRGVLPQAACIICPLQFTLRDPFIFASRDEWKPIFHQSLEAQKALCRDGAFRQAFRAGLARPDPLFTGDWKLMLVAEVADPKLKPHQGKVIADIAAASGKDPVDAFLDLAIEDDLNTRFEFHHEGSELRLASLVGDDRVMIGLGDSGAHVDMFCGANYATHLLGSWVRERRVLSLEHAVKRITSEPADFFGLADRGRLQTGRIADIAIFDPATVGEGGPTHAIRDLPNGGLRLAVKARGMEYVIVNGQVAVEHGAYRDVLPGQVLRAS